MEQLSFGLAMALKPLGVVLFLGFLVCVRFAVIKWMKPGKLKDLLLRRV